MPAIFDNGMWACGRGAIAWGRGKTVLGRLEKAGPACILDQQHVVCQAFHKGRWQVVAIDVAGGEVRIVSTRGATELVAQGGKWARLLGNDMTTGTLLGETRTYTNAAPVDVAIDGRIGYKPRHQPDGVGLGIIRPDGQTVRISDTVARDVAVVPGRDAAVWARTNGLGAAGIAVVSVPRPTAKPRVLVIDGRPWLLYQFSFPNTGGKGGRLVLHPFDSLDGYVVAESRTNLQAHRPAAVRLSDGSLLIPYCRTEGESVESLELPHRTSRRSTRGRVRLCRSGPHTGAHANSIAVANPIAGAPDHASADRTSRRRAAGTQPLRWDAAGSQTRLLDRERDRLGAPR